MKKIRRELLTTWRVKNMKKILWFLIGLMLISSVFAQGSNNAENNQGFAEKVQNMFQNRAQNMERVQSQHLERVQLRFQEQAQQQAMEQILARISENNQNSLNGLENAYAQLDTNDEVIIEGRGEALLFGLIRAQRRFEYRVTEQGDVIYQNKWYDRFWRGE